MQTTLHEACLQMQAVDRKGGGWDLKKQLSVLRTAQVAVTFLLLDGTNDVLGFLIPIILELVQTIYWFTVYYLD